jgi:hypothetical protein
LLRGHRPVLACAAAAPAPYCITRASQAWLQCLAGLQASLQLAARPPHNTRPSSKHGTNKRMKMSLRHWACTGNAQQWRAVSSATTNARRLTVQCKRLHGPRSGERKGGPVVCTDCPALFDTATCLLLLLRSQKQGAGPSLSGLGWCAAPQLPAGGLLLAGCPGGAWCRLPSMWEEMGRRPQGNGASSCATGPVPAASALCCSHGVCVSATCSNPPMCGHVQAAAQKRMAPPGMSCAYHGMLPAPCLPLPG